MRGRSKFSTDATLVGDKVRSRLVLAAPPVDGEVGDLPESRQREEGLRPGHTQVHPSHVGAQLLEHLNVLRLALAGATTIVPTQLEVETAWKAKG